MLLSTLAVLAFLVSALSAGIVLVDDADAAGTWSGENPSGSSSTNPYDAIDIGASGTNLPVLNDVYVKVGAGVSITGCTESWSHGSANYTINFTGVTSGYGLSVSTSGDTSVSGTITKAGNITISYHYIQTGTYPKDENRSFVIHAVDPDAGLVQSISIRSSVSTGTVTTGGSVTLTATTSPTSADDRHVEWSIQSGSQYGEITRTTNTTTGGTCTVKATDPGTIVVRCESVDGNASETYTITVTQRMVTSISIYQGFQSGDDLIVTADVWPSNAHNTELSWSVTQGSGLVSMEDSDEYTNDSERRFVATGNGSGEFTVRVSATDGSGVYEERTFYVNHVAFDANGGSGAPSDSYTVRGSYTANGHLPSQEPSRSGYAFMGWSSSTSGAVLYPAGGYGSMRDGTTYYAIWGLETSVYYHVTQGTGGPTGDSIIIMEGDSDWYYVSDEKPYRAGYTFLGWSENPSASTASYEPGQGISIQAGTEEINLYDVWTITENEYHLTYDANGGVNAPATQDGTNYGVENTYRFIVTSSEPTYAGYKFQGWSTVRDGEVEYRAGDEYIAPVGTTTLYAVWQKINTFSIAYDANGGQGAPQPEVNTWDTVDPSIRIIISTVLPTWDEFHRFTGWSLDQNAEVADISPGSSYTLTQTGTTTFYAIWEEIEGNTFTLHFDLNGGLVGPEDVVSVTVQDETYITIPSDIPSWDEYRIFLGWSLVKGSDEVDYSPGERIHMDESEKTLYAVWQRLPMPWVLHFDLNGGQWDSTDQTGTSADYTYTFIIPDIEPTYEGFGFRGWAATDGGDVEYHPGDEYVADTQESTLYAIWEELSLFTLSFNVNGGSDMESLTGYGLDECTFTIPSEVPVLEGKLFEGWATMEGGAVDCQPGQTITVTLRNTILYAVWVERPSTMEYVLKFEVGDGSGGPNALREIDSADSHTFTVPAGTPVRDGFGFLGWSLSQNGNAEYHAGDTITVVTLTTTLYAVWIDESLLNTFTLRFDLNGGTGDIKDMTGTSLEGTYVFNIPSEIPERNGFVFVGWAVAANPSEVAYRPGEIMESSASVATLYAVWQPEDVVFTLSYYGGDGATDVPIMMTGIAESNVHSFTIPSQEPVMEGFVFVGWSPEYGGDAVYMPGDVYVSGVRDATLYAVWEVKDDGAIHIANVPNDRIDAGSQFTWEVAIDADVPFTVTIGGSASEWLNVNNHTVRGTSSTPGTYTLTVTVTDGDDYYPSTESYTIRVMEHDMEYRVEFMTSGGTQVDEQWIQSGGNATAPEEPVRDGFRFGGWYTSDGSKYDFMTAVGSDMTLRALWISDGSMSVADDDDGDDIPWTLIAAGIVLAIVVIAVVVTRLL